MTVEFAEVTVYVDGRDVTETQVVVDCPGSIIIAVIVVGVSTVSVVVNAFSPVIVEYVLSVSHVVIAIVIVLRVAWVLLVTVVVIVTVTEPCVKVTVLVAVSVTVTEPTVTLSVTVCTPVVVVSVTVDNRDWVCVKVQPQEELDV